MVHWGMADVLPAAPIFLRFEDVELQFDCLTVGDEERGLVPGYRFGIHGENGLRVGRIHFRVGKTRHVQMYAGHIGYEIEPEFRGHGFARKACLALAPFVAEVSGEVVLTANLDNAASLRTIEQIGAEFLDEVDVDPDDPHYDGGKNVRKRRYRWNAEGRVRKSEGTVSRRVV